MIFLICPEFYILHSTFYIPFEILRCARALPALTQDDRKRAADDRKESERPSSVGFADTFPQGGRRDIGARAPRRRMTGRRANAPLPSASPTPSPKGEGETSVAPNNTQKRKNHTFSFFPLQRGAACGKSEGCARL